MSDSRRQTRQMTRSGNQLWQDRGLSPLVSVFDHGARLELDSVETVVDALQASRESNDRFAILHYLEPAPDAIRELADVWELHPVLVEDLLHAKQRPKVERYDDTLFIVARSARYIDETEEVDFTEFHLLVRDDAVAIICQDGRWLDGTLAEDLTPERVRERMTNAFVSSKDLLSHGPEAVVYRLLDAIVDGYSPVLQGIALDKEQIERQVFGGDTAVTERIYRLSSEVIDMQHTTSSLEQVINAISRGFSKYSTPEDLQTYLQDVADHLTRVNTRILEYREALSQILSVNATLVAQRQNEDMKKISGWAAILFAPTLIAAIYGMNFDHMPELHWLFGYPAAVLLMVVFAVGLYIIFKRHDWM